MNATNLLKSSTLSQTFYNISPHRSHFSLVSQLHTPRRALTCNTCKHIHKNKKPKKIKPSVCFQCLHKLLEVTTAPVRKAFFNVSLFFGQFFLCQRLSYETSGFRIAPVESTKNTKPLSINSCAARRSSSSFSGASSGVCCSRTVATIPFSRYQHQ